MIGGNVMRRTGIIAGLILLAGCGGGNDVILPGVREALREDTTQQTQNQVRPIRLAAAKTNADWTHRMGGADHRMAHPALSANLTPLFSVNIGAAQTRRNLITADPVVADGRVFTMDAHAQVVASSTGGAPLWSRALVPAFDKSGEGAGGGLTVGGGKLFATSGFGEVSALDTATGEILWRQELSAPGTAAPTVSGGLVYVVSRDNVGWAIDAETGRVRWTISGTPAPENYGGGAGVAVAGETAVFPFAGGEVLATFPKGGLRRWSTVVTGQRLGYAAATISDISGDPVIDGNRVYVGNISGRAVALNRETGDRIWTATMAAKNPVWPAGDSVFLVNDLNELVRLNAADGSVIWRTVLPQFADKRFGKDNLYYAQYGPILAGGWLIVASSDGTLRQFDPKSGALLSQVALSSGAAALPAVAGGALYVVTTDGMLHAFR